MDTVMVYAKLYSRKITEEYRKAMHGVCSAFYGFKMPTGKSGMRSPLAAACAIWELIFAEFRQARTAAIQAATDGLVRRVVLNRIPQIGAEKDRHFRQVLFLCDKLDGQKRAKGLSSN